MLHGLSRALGSKFVVVSGLATWDVMRRARTHMSGQSLAGSMCRAAAGGLAARGRTAYVFLPDLDEYLSPPATEAAQSHRLATHLAGSLRRLARHVHSGIPATALYLDDPHAIRSRVYAGHGTSRCLSFASVYYYPPMCPADAQTVTATRAGVDRRPAILRRSWRGQPDNFEAGPSHNWTYFPRWNFFMRSKYMIDASDGSSMLTGNHECCCRPRLIPEDQCAARSGRLGNHTCATLEFMPLEHWHVRHFRGEGLGHRDAESACRRPSPITAVLGAPGAGRRRVVVEPQETIFPQSWSAEYTTALGNLSLRLTQAMPMRDGGGSHHAPRSPPALRT
jgi:hypothetical protein